MAPYIGLGVRLGGGARIAQQVPPWYGDLAPRAAYLAHPDEYSEVAEWGDDTGGGRILTASAAGTTAAFNATGVNGKPGIMFASGKNLGGASAADWAFLHSGEYGIAGELYLPSALNTQAIFSTYTVAAKSGSWLFYNGTTRTFWFQEQNASASILSCQTAVNSLGVPPNTHKFYIQVSRSAGTPDARLYVDGVQLQTANYTGANLVGPPTQALKLATSTGAGVQHFIGGGIRSLLFFDHGNAAAADVFAALDAAESQRQLREFVCFGNSITETTDSFRVSLSTRINRGRATKALFRGSRTGTAAFPLVDKRHEGVSGETVAQIQARIAAYTVTTETDCVIEGGSNSLASLGASGSLTDMSALLTTAEAKFPTQRLWLFEIPYGDGSLNTTYTAAGVAGAYNAGLDAMLASHPRVRKIPLHAAGGATTWVWDPLTCTYDNVGHPTPTGKVVMGEAAAQKMGLTI